jgi:hypothetical protein
LKTLLGQKRDVIVRGWVRAALEIYPAGMVAFYGKEKNSFANPVGTVITAGIEGLFDALVTDAPPGEFVPHLDRILQVRCVQDFPPSQAIWFIFALKGVIRDVLAGELKDAAALRGLIVFESRIDRMAACAFDVYAGYQKKIAEIRVNEIKNRVSTLSRMSKISYGDPEVDPEQKGGPIDKVRCK